MAMRFRVGSCPTRSFLDLTRSPLHSGSRINPTWFALDSSRGIETPDSAIFMRSTVLVLDALIYIPALLMFTRTWQATRSKRTQVLHLLAVQKET
jgi:ALG6, ALG8 glycosyltransferase family